MAMRTVARRWPGASEVRAVLRSGRQQEQLQQSRAYSSQEVYSGKGFEEKEKAAENRFIRQKEEERKLKKAADETSSQPEGQSPLSSPVTEAATGEAATGGFRTTAVVAGIVAVVAGYWLLSGSGSSEKEEKEST